ncbi:predicted protein [Naegleria gruberi]|uniref:Predicted protein n=1 Tax=Naegleria gruberi TaxID=5762 RepID=D2VDQ9_NAEGR|nr:uncharacterized protein NAEGRDRAFT_67007 [Naegleria gruberi]EFC44941.1 predicted protein [Naegleria gruberi]|eukprot:XP_002677685.1 predicted protein [Naegleria gruberi strain NEG-M]
MLTNETLIVTVTFVSAFGQQAVKSFPLKLSKPYPKPSSTIPTRTVTFLSSEDETIPLREFYENPECLDQGIVPSFSLYRGYYDDYFTMDRTSSHSVILTSDLIIVKSLTFTNEEILPIWFGNSARIRLDVRYLPPIPKIVESIVYYNFIQPSITIACRSPYGDSYFYSSIRYSLLEDSSKIANGYASSATVPVRVLSAANPDSAVSSALFELTCSGPNRLGDTSISKYVTFIKEQPASSTPHQDIVKFLQFH